ncbi:MAG TPA: hypothetical protein VFI20_07310 [Terracidiphilus sp.]|nr:hypothetical protein [Terracidiphilus sp.]
MRQEIYRTAFEEANSELTEILGKFDQLRQRKERIEKVVEMLRPMAGSGSEPMQTRSSFNLPEMTAEPYSAPVVAEVAKMTLQEEVGEPVEVAQHMGDHSSDPFQRRIDSALGMGGGTRDSREFGRRFNGTAHRG